MAVLDLGDLAPGDKDADTEVPCHRAALLAGQWLHEVGGTANLSADEWLDRWRAFRRQSPAAKIVEPHVDAGFAPGQAGGPDTSAESGVVLVRDRTLPCP